MIVQPAILYGMETVPVTSSHVKKTGSDRHEDVQMGMRRHAKRPCEKRKHEGETEGGEYRREVQESATQAVWPPKKARPRLRRKKDSGDGVTREKKARKTEADMDGLCQPRHESHRNDERRGPWPNWLEENCVCRSVPTTKWERLEEEEVLSVDDAWSSSTISVLW